MEQETTGTRTRGKHREGHENTNLHTQAILLHHCVCCDVLSNTQQSFNHIRPAHIRVHFQPLLEHGSSSLVLSRLVMMNVIQL